MGKKKDAVALLPRVKKERKWMRYEFTPAELSQMGKSLAEQTERVEQLGKAKDEVVADFKSKITTAETACSSLAMGMNKGFEMRDVECEIKLHFPVNGTKRITRLDTGEFKDDPMDAQEMQEQLPIGNDGDEE